MEGEEKGGEERSAKMIYAQAPETLAPPLMGGIFLRGSLGIKLQMLLSANRDHQAHLCTLLNGVNLPHADLLCRNVTCSDTDHLNALNNYANCLTNACTEASFARFRCTENRASIVAIFPGGILLSNL